MGLDGVEIVMECEDAFEIKVSDQDASSCYRVVQLQDLCIRLVAEQVAHCPLPIEHEQRIRLHVREIIAEQMCIRIEKIMPESRFVQDLGID